MQREYPGGILCIGAMRTQLGSWNQSNHMETHDVLKRLRWRACRRQCLLGPGSLIHEESWEDVFQDRVWKLERRVEMALETERPTSLPHGALGVN